MATGYSDEFKQRALRLLEDRMNAEDKPSLYKATNEIAPKLGAVPETLRRWFKKAEINSDKKTGPN